MNVGESVGLTEGLLEEIALGNGVGIKFEYEGTRVGLALGTAVGTEVGF